MLHIKNNISPNATPGIVRETSSRRTRKHLQCQFAITTQVLFDHTRTSSRIESRLTLKFMVLMCPDRRRVPEKSLRSGSTPRVGAIVQAVGSGLWVVGHMGHVVVIKRYRVLSKSKRRYNMRNEADRRCYLSV